jgi:crossover junction endodeoxyribonuclease RuvC
MRLIGIDPGARGAIALFVDGVFERVCDMPCVAVKGKARIDCAALGSMLRELAPDAAVIEQVASMPRQGVASMFAFGMAYGAVLGVCGALEIPVTLVTAVEWKGALRVRASDDPRVRASQLIPKAAKHWPRVRDDGRAEACLIAHYRANCDSGVIVW